MNHRCFLVTIFCCVIGVNSVCLQAPVGELPEGCDVGNLFVKEYSFGYRQIIDEVACNSTMDRTFFVFAPKVQLRENISSSSNQTYLLTAVDRTNEILIWMVSNLTVQANNVIYLPFSTYPSETEQIQLYKGWFSNEYTTVEFLVFEEHRRNASASYNIDNATFTSAFNLSTWIDSQQNSGITICGPVAGGSVVVHNPNVLNLSSIFAFDLPQWNISDIKIPKIPELTEQKPRSFLSWVKIYYRFICFGIFVLSLLMAAQKKGCRRAMKEKCCGYDSDEEDETHLAATSNNPHSSSVDSIPMRGKSDDPQEQHTMTPNTCHPPPSFVYSITMEEKSHDDCSSKVENDSQIEASSASHVDSVPKSFPSYRPNSSYY